MAYTPYSQALPDTSRYTLDPVLQERLYQPVRTDPYQSGMLSTMANDYYEDPFGYTNKRFGKLDETLETDAPEVGLDGMFAPPPPMYGSDADGFGGGGGEDGGGVGGFGIGMGIGGVDAGIAGPGAGLGMSGQQGGILGGILGGLFGMPGLGYQIGKSIAQDAPTTVTPQSVVNAAYQTAAVNAARDARDASESGATPSAQAAANAIANEAAIAAAQSSGSAPTGLGGDLGTGASDAAGFGGYGGVW